MKKSKLLLTLLMAGLMTTSAAGLAGCDFGTSSTGSSSTAPSNDSSTTSTEQNSTPTSTDSEQGGGEETCTHVDANNDHACDTCGDIVSECADADNDHACDVCGDVLSECVDEDEDDYCDICEEFVGVEEDTEAPVITVSGNPTVIELGLGEELQVPTATATDNVDGQLDVEIFCETTRGAYNNKTGVFKTEILGQHLLTYYACDANDNETFLDIVINVTSDTYQETNNVDGYNDLAILNGEGTFKENFEKGWQSPLIKKASLPDVEIKAGEQALNGNSLVIDYTQLLETENRIFLNTLPIRDGIWTLSFDVKLISGVADSDFYIGYVKEGETDSKDQQFSLADMQVGDVKRVEYKQLLNLDEDGTYYFHFFEHMRDMQAVLAFDNFEVTYEAAPTYNEVVPTFDALKAGFTYDWENAYMSITSGMPEEVAKIEDATAKAAIEGAASGFAASVMHLTGSGAHDLSAIMKEKDAMFFQEGWTYIFEIDYYAASVGGHYMIAYDGTPSNRVVKVSPFTAGLNKATIEYTVGANDKALTFYGDMDVYLGNMKITVKEPTVVRTDFHNVTSEEVMAEGGYTYDWSENNIVELSANAKYLEIAKMDDTDLASALVATNAFTKGYAMKFAGASSSYINCLNGMLIAGNKYTISFDAYDKTPGSITVLLMDAGSAQVGQANFNVTDKGNGMKTYTATFTAAANHAQVNLYIITECELYLANLTIAGAEPSADVTENTTTGTRTWAELNLGRKGTQVATPEKVAACEGFAADYTLQITATGGEVLAEMFRLANLMPAGQDFKSLTMTVKYYIEDGFTGSGVFIALDTSTFIPMPVNPGYNTYTFKADSLMDFINFYTQTGTSGTIYLGSIDYVLVTTGDVVQPEPEVERTDFYAVTNDDMKAEGGYTYDWSENKIVEISANASYVKIEKMEDKDLAAALTATNAYPNGYALKLAGMSSSYINCLNGKLVAGNKYTISFDAYDKVAGSVTVLLMNEAGVQVGQANFNVTDNGNGTKKYTATFTATASYAQVNLYIITECEWYLANLTLVEAEPTAEIVENTTTGTRTWLDLNMGGKGTQVATPAEVAACEGFATDYTLKITATGGEMIAEMFQLGNIMPQGQDFKSVTFTVKYYVVDGFNGTGLYLYTDNGAFNQMPATPGYHVATFTLDSAMNFVNIYSSTGTTGDIYMACVEYTLVTLMEAPSVTEKTTTGTRVWSNLNAGGKGTQVETPEKVAACEGFAADYTLQVTTGGNLVAEMFQLSDIMPQGQAFKSLTLTITYYVEDGFVGGGLYLYYNGNVFQPMPATPGYHTFTYTIDTEMTWINIHIGGDSAGTIYLASVDYTLVTIG